MSADERHAVREETSERGAVVHVHELRGNEPCRVAVLLHPRGGEEDKIDIQARKPVDLDARHVMGQRLQALLVLALQVVVPHVDTVIDVKWNEVRD